MQVSIRDIHIKDRLRMLDADHARELAESIRELGLLNPLTVDRDYTLIAGLHRLEAVKLLGWTKVECTVSSLEGLQAELAEIDENVVRSNLSAVEYGEMLLRRKELYEALHPETKATYEGGRFKGNQYSDLVADKMSATKKSFVQDTAEKLGVDPRTVRREIQTAKRLTPEAKKIIMDADAKISKKSAMKLSRLEPEQQKEAAALLAAREIRSVDEYVTKAGEEGEPEEIPREREWTCLDEAEQSEGLSTASPDCYPQDSYLQGQDPPVSFREMVAQLKDPDKDCSGTPESFLSEYIAFVRKFHREIEWYSNPYYDTVFPCLTPEQLACLREQTESICHAAMELFQKVERKVKK